ncbi:MAG: copper amine oxidase N-terminal domain-containing protein [Clostridiales bacterium]|nr:copper amine oxidase N-terminal domain-containing protein [Clostridiales bacterium]
MKRFAAVISSFILTGLLSVSAYAKITTVDAVFGDMSVTVDGEEYNMKPLIINGTSYFPVRTLGYILICDVRWVDETREIILAAVDGEVEDGSFSQTAADLAGTKKAVFDDSITLIADGIIVSEPVAIVDDRSYIPVRAVAEAMNKRAEWNETTRTIEIINRADIQADDEIKDYYVGCGQMAQIMV